MAAALARSSSSRLTAATIAAANSGPGWPDTSI
jgi:hypothetical protein